MKKKMIWGATLIMTVLFYLFLLFLEAKARKTTFLLLLKSRTFSLILAGIFFVAIIVPSFKPIMESLIEWIFEHLKNKKGVRG
ncbi:hypothetical protein J7K91_00315 [bacterium]|nr:hypothetical protein [bacterium]